MSDSEDEAKISYSTSNAVILGILGTVVCGLLTWMAISYFGNVAVSVESVEKEVARIQDTQHASVEKTREDAARMYQVYMDNLQTLRDQVAMNQFSTDQIIRIIDKSQIVLDQIPVINQKILHLETQPNTSPQIKEEIRALREQLDGLKREVDKLRDKLALFRPPVHPEQ